MDKFSFVVLLDYVTLTLEDLFTFGLTLNEDESDLNLGYFTVEGENQSIQEFRSFLRGSTYI